MRNWDVAEQDKVPTKEGFPLQYVDMYHDLLNLEKARSHSEDILLTAQDQQHQQKKRAIAALGRAVQNTVAEREGRESTTQVVPGDV